MVQKLTKTKMFRGRRYALDQVYWDEERARHEAAEAREHGFYSFVVPVMYRGEKKYARYTANKRYAPVTKKRTRS